MNRLILIEGLPGTGKTTLAKWLSDGLTDKGIENLLLLEGDERVPCDFYETAGIPSAQFEDLCASNPEISKELHAIARKTENYYYLRIDKSPEIAKPLLRPYDIGDGSNASITVNDYIPCALERLQDWVSQNPTGGKTVIMESGYLQNPINELLFRHASDEEVRSFINSITQILRPLSPVCIYLRRNTADEAINFAKMVKGSGWAERVDNLLKQTGCEDLFRRRFKLELELLPQIKNLCCHVCGGNWDDVKRKINRFFSL